MDCQSQIPLFGHGHRKTLHVQDRPRDELPQRRVSGGEKPGGRVILAFSVALILHALAAMWTLPDILSSLRYARSLSPQANDGLPVSVLPEVADRDLSRLEGSPNLPAYRTTEETEEKPAQVPVENPAVDQSEKWPNNDLGISRLVYQDEGPPPPSYGIVGECGHLTNEADKVLVGGPDILTATSPQSDISRQNADDLTLDASEVKPRYPLGSRIRGEEGIVQIKLRLSDSGFARDVEIFQSSGFRALDRAALEAVRKAHFKIASEQMAGREAVLNIRFKLEN